MKYSAFFRDEFLKKNYTVQDILTRYDKENGVSDGKFSKSELKVFIDEAVIPLGTFLLGKKFLTNTVFNLLDNDKAEKKDNYITQAELNYYLDKYAETDLEEMKPMTVLEACDFLDIKEAVVKRKKQQEKNK